MKAPDVLDLLMSSHEISRATKLQFETDYLWIFLVVLVQLLRGKKVRASADFFVQSFMVLVVTVGYLELLLFRESQMKS